MSSRVVPDSVIAEQLKAADPDASAWVAANAGSGKTYVLALRVVKLLLRGVDPAKILCVTFTKAAAANMAMRVFTDLAKWTACDDATLDAAIRSIGEKPDAALRAKARRLFATALETPGGLKVQTIHAFCTRLLHQFPFEADVAARFGVLDEATEHEIVEELILDIMLKGASNPDSALGRAFTTTIAAAADQTLRDVIRAGVAERDRIESWVAQAGSLEAAVGQLSRALGLEPEDTAESIRERFFSESHIPKKQWKKIAAALLDSTKKTDHRQGELFNRLHDCTGDEQLEVWLSIFCTQEYKARAKIVTNEIEDRDPRLADLLKTEQGRICELLEKQNALACRDRTAALITIAHAVIADYRAEKDRRGLLDYDDLIDRTLNLFRNSSAAWVLYKLDLGIDHILIDEAQDTSPKQWEIIRTLAHEFTAGAGARQDKRTLFVVGDDKQSIFSFQGAAPEKFDEMRRLFKSAFEAVALEWRSIKLQTSFRSGEVVLSAVNDAFRSSAIYPSITSDKDGMPPHEWIAGTAPGAVEIWPLILPSGDTAEQVGWDAPFDRRSETGTVVRLARRIAKNVALWCERGGRPGDVLVLVRQRGALFETVIRALKDARIPVAGADRLVLTEHIAVMDLMALADALLLPQDDLALATVLKSPLFDLTEEELFALAWNRGTLTLRESLFGKGADNPRFAAAAQRIDLLTGAARTESPFAFYARVLNLDHGRKCFLARLGAEASDALDEFLNLALAYESRETPSLQGFVAWLRAAEADIKRDMEITRDEVRVMTVHGAKGLEAPIVILGDTTTPPAGYHPPRLMELPLAACPGLIWAAAAKSDAPAMAQARVKHAQAAVDEYRRLLYVAMTRAQHKLIVCGTASRIKKDNSPSIPAGCWYEIVKQALVDEPREPGLILESAADDGEGNVWRYRKSATIADAGVAKKPDPDPAPPAWLDVAARSEPRRATIVTPSSDEEFTAQGEAGPSDRNAGLARGRVVHRLMQSLPDVAREHREIAARRYLERAGSTLAAADRDDIVKKALAILDDPRFAPLFGPGSRAEVPIVGRLANRSQPDSLVAGQVDRLVVTKDAVFIADYKTNRPAPRSLDDLLARQSGYVRQLALYRAVLALIYPDRPIRAALLWTDVPDLMEIPADILDQRIALLTPA